MLQYIYFVKCPNCEDEPFDFFDEAKEFACSCLSKKPIITQVEVDRNDFGECVNSFDLGTIWSWEDIMKETDTEPTVSVFTKGDFAEYNPDRDEEFDALDNSVNFEVGETLKESAPRAELEKAFNDAGYVTEPGTYDFKTIYDNYVKKNHKNPEALSDIIQFIKAEVANHHAKEKANGKGFDAATKTLMYKVKLREPIPEGMTNWNSTVPGYYGEHIFNLLDKMTGDDINRFMYEYNWFDTLKLEAIDALSDKYDHIRNYLDTESGYQLWSDLDKYCAYRGIIESLKEPTDNSRKPIPEGMTIEQLVEEMEENEDTVECVGCEELFPKEDCFHKDGIGWLCSDCEDTVVKCTWCEELFDKSQCRYEVDLGWLCSRCEMAIKSRGETLTFRENSFLDEAKEVKVDPERSYAKIIIPLQQAIRQTFAGIKFLRNKQVMPQFGVSDNTTIKLVSDSRWNGQPYLTFCITQGLPQGTTADGSETTRIAALKDQINKTLTEFKVDQILFDIEQDPDYDFAKFTGNNKRASQNLLYASVTVKLLDNKEKALKETFNPREWVAFDYDELEIEAAYGRQDPDDGSYPSVKHKDSYTYWKRAEDVAEDLWDRFITEEDTKDIPGGLEALEDEAAWVEFLSTHFDSLVEKHYEEFLEYYEEDAKAEFEQEFDYDDYVDGVRSDMAYDEYRDSLCEKLEEADEYRKHLTMCPECGDSAFDAGTGFCISCGFN